MRAQSDLTDNSEKSVLSSIEQYRPLLMRFALLHLREQHLAEDVVQETFLAVSEKPATFSERSSI